MISVDTNILLHAQNADSADHELAYAFLVEFGGRDGVVICDMEPHGEGMTDDDTRL